MPLQPAPKPVPTPTPAKRRAPNQSKSLIIGSAVAFLAMALLLVAATFLLGPSERHKHPKVTTSSPLPATSQPNALAAVAASSSITDDDGKTLWVSPTDGEPIDLAYVAPGSQVIIATRLAALMQQPEGAKVIAALGPLGEQAVRHLEEITTLPLANIERLIIGCQITSEGQWHFTFVVQPATAITREQLLAKLPAAASKEHAGKSYSLSNGLAYFVPESDQTHRFVIAPEQSIGDIIDLAGAAPPLRRDIERLLASTDADRDLTIVFAPNSLFAEGRSMFVGEASSLRAPLFWFLGDELSGAALSLHWDTDFFLELIATPTLDTATDKATLIFDQRVREIPNRIEAYVVALNPQPYARLIIARFPEMLRKLAAYTRSGYEKDHAVLRCYLPAVAGHNLLMAAELTLAESNADATPSTAQTTPQTLPAASPPGAATIHERLAKVTSLKFSRDTLESALDQLAQDIAAPIVIRGPDLQADGITKNQSFGIDVSNKPAAEILVEILRLANPDKTATAANDPRQKLVFIIEQKPDKTEQIVVTTRARAAERHDTLPEAFRDKKR